MKDLFGWLYSSDRDHGSTEAATLVNALIAGLRNLDPEAMRLAREGLEALAIRRSAPWLGVFGRHWELQGRLNHLDEGASALPDAVTAFEISRRPENRDCPQSVCAVQDLCIAFLSTDGPSYASQVVQTCDEALGRVDPTWPCFDCIATELTKGLLVRGDAERALEVTVSTQATIRETGSRPSSFHFVAQLDALLGADFAQAAEVARAFEARRFDFRSSYGPTVVRMKVAETLVKTGFLDEGLEGLGEWPDPVEVPALAEGWLCLAECVIAAHPDYNTPGRRRTAVVLAQRHLAKGRFRHAFDTAITAGLWNASAGALSNGNRCLDVAREAILELVEPHGAHERIEELVAALNSELLATPEGDDARLEILEQRYRAKELEQSDVFELGSLRVAQGWAGDANELVVAFAEQDLTNQAGVLAASRQLLQTGDAGGAKRLAGLVEPVDPLIASWILAMTASSLGEWDDCCAQCAAVVAFDESVVNARRLWASAARNLGDFATASGLRGEVMDLCLENGLSESALVESDAWEAIVDGSAAKEWGLVRSAADLLNISLDGQEGPIVESWELITVESIDDIGRIRRSSARRTGPATARIEQVSPPWQQTQNFGDSLVFLPASASLNTDSKISTYQALVVTDPGGYHSIVVKGSTPAEEDASSLARGITDAGYFLSSYGYERTGDNPRSIVDLVIAVGQQIDEVELDEELTRLTTGWDGFIAWPTLLERLGRPTAEHDARVDAFYESFDDDEA